MSEARVNLELAYSSVRWHTEPLILAVTSRRELEPHKNIVPIFSRYLTAKIGPPLYELIIEPPSHF